LLDSSGQVVFAPNAESVGTRLDYRHPDCQLCHGLRPEERPDSVIVTSADGQRVFRNMYPLENSLACARCHDPKQRLIGLLLTDIPMAPLEEPLAAGLRQDLLRWAGIILASVVIINLAMHRVVIRRLTGVVQTLGRFDRRHSNLRLPTGSPDEIGLLVAAFNDMGQRIQAEEAENQVLSEDLRRLAEQRRALLKRLITAQEEERQRVARDLHDELGQDLAGLAVSLEVIERLWAEQPEQARFQLQQTRTRIAETSARTYDMILGLRPSALDDLGLAPALRMHAERTLNPADMQLEIDARDLTSRLPPEIETALFRTFQEALSNVVRHAEASRVRVRLAVRNGAFEGEITDDGQGFNVEIIRADGDGPRGLGLLGMRERVALCGGTLEIFSRPGAGTRLRIRVPLPEEHRG
jgi:signal transduction histidine kinase